jgi:epoxyqueuosine reductase QueG
LGCIGKNSLFIDYIYGSFVFIGTIITNYEFNFPAKQISTCLNCGKCLSACPNNAVSDNGIDRSKCLSGISQKKKKTILEIELLRKNNIVWGCDICQLCCPHNSKAQLSPLSNFKNTRVDIIDKEYLQSLSDEDFNKFPFAYKGRDLIYHNLDFKQFRP